MKFGTLLELNSNIEWWNEYVDYDALKKLFPSVPLDPAYLSTQQHAENASLLPTHTAPGSTKFATSLEFRQALDKERNKVIEFYKSKLEEITSNYRSLEQNVAEKEDEQLLGVEDDVIEEEEEGEETVERRPTAEGEGGLEPEESEHLIRSPSKSVGGSSRKYPKARPSVLGRFTSRLGLGSRKSSLFGTGIEDEADIMNVSHRRSRSRSAQRSANGRASLEASWDHEQLSPNLGKVPLPKPSRRPSDMESSADDGPHDRRTSMSSNSTGYNLWGKKKVLNLGLEMMDPAQIPEHAFRRYSGEGDDTELVPVFIWGRANDENTMYMRVGFKRQISAVWLEAYALKTYVDLNLTAFEKILKKYDKNTNSKLKKTYIEEQVLTSYPWLASSKEELDRLLAQILFLYTRVVTSGDETSAKEQLRLQLREKIVVDRGTVWSQAVSARRSAGIFRSVEPETFISAFEPDKRVWNTPFGRFTPPTWISGKGLIFLLALNVMAGIVALQPFERVEESNCLAMLVFCTILWATEAIPLFVTSLGVPMLVVLLRVLRSEDDEDRRLSAAESTKYIFSQMFSPTIMLLIGGFTIAAVLSKTRLDVMTATRILKAAGTRPSVVLLALMSVATFASMWISNVAAPTLCYALIKPITDELHPKSYFSRCLIIAIALASNIGGQASPISSPQNLIALLAMDPPLSWLQWFAISIPVSSISVVAIWAFLHLGYKWEEDLRIPPMRRNTDTLTRTHYYVLFVSALTIALWCMEKHFEDYVGDMGIIALIPLLAFFGTGILSKEDFHSFHWSIVFLAMGGIALGKAVLSSGLLDDLDRVLEEMVDGMGLYSILIVFSLLALVIATFISHTIAAVLLVPIATRIGESLEDPHPRLLIMVTALICSAGMGLPVSGFPNMTAITQENKLGTRFIEASDFLKNGIPASILATFVIVTIGVGVMKLLQL